MKKELKQKIQQLLQLTELYRQTLNTVPNKSKKTIQGFKQIKILHQALKKFSPSPDCEFVEIEVVAPHGGSTWLSTSKIILGCRAKKTCTLENEVVTINFDNGSTQSIPVEPTWQGNIAITEFELIFSEKATSASISVFGLAPVAIQYQPKKTPNNIIMEASDTLTKSANIKNTLKYNSPISLPYSDEVTNYETLFETLPLKQPEKTVKWYKVIDVAGVKQFLKNNPISTDYTTWSREELEEEKRKNKLKYNYTDLLESIRKRLAVYEGIGLSYEEADKKEHFDSDYNENIKQAKLLVGLLAERITAMTTAEELLEKAISDKKVPAVIAEKASWLLEQYKATATKVRTTKDHLETYYEIELDFEGWKTEIEKTTTSIEQLKKSVLEDWHIWETLLQKEEAVTSDLTNNEDYTEWKKKKNTSLGEKKDRLLGVLEKLLTNSPLQKRAEVIAGGNTRVIKDTLSKAEKEKWNNNIELRPVDKKLFDQGTTIDDIGQGYFGDCYLMTAVANIVQVKPDFFETIIKQEGDKYTVTLYKEGVPIDVVVDGNLMAFKDDPRYVGAQPQNDSWVAILEKAYVMLYGNGDFTSEEVVGGHAPAAMRAILGNKSSSPNRIYLDEAGNISEQETETVVNMPIKLSKITLDLLQKVLIAAKKANYSISVGSPSSIGGIEGLTDRHVISIGNNNYMNFKHAYSLTDATSTHVQLFNPQGEEAKTKLIYNEKLVQLMADLKKVWKNIKTTVQQTNELSTADRATLTPILESLFATDIDSSKLKNSWQTFNNKPTFKLNLWNRIIATLEELIQDKEISKGMVKLPEDKPRKIPHTPTISYQTLQKYFDLIEITIIK